MILSGKEIIKGIESKDIQITPFNINKVNPNSYNLSLYNKLLVYTDDVLDMKKLNNTKEIIIPEEGYILAPNKLYLGRTNEHTQTFKYIPMLEGRSSIGRLGVCIHVTAGIGSIGFHGYWTLELFCIQPVKIYPNIDRCQIYYHTIKGDYDLYSSDKYQNNKDIQPSLLYKELI